VLPAVDTALSGVVGGVAAGAEVGSVAGPIGAVVGAAIGAAAGGTTGKLMADVIDPARGLRAGADPRQNAGAAGLLSIHGSTCRTRRCAAPEGPARPARLTRASPAILEIWAARRIVSPCR
jgi:hypothetical protein